MTSEMLATIIETLGEYFRSPLTVPATRAYAMGLEELTDEQLQLAARRAIKECKFMPTAAELLAFAGRKPRNVASEAAEAWGDVRKAIDQHDHSHAVDFGSLVNAVVRNVGGWQRLCGLGLTDLDVWARKEFERVYAMLAEKDPATLQGEFHAGSVDGPVYQVAIGGNPPARALPAVETPQAAKMRDVVRELAEAKSQAGAARESGLPVPTAPPPREAKPKVPPMTEADLAARKAEIAAQFAARGVTA